MPKPDVLSDEQLASLETLGQQATPGPLTLNVWSALDSHSVAISAEGGADRDGYILAELVQEDEQAVKDGKSLVASYNALPALLAEVRAARQRFDFLAHLQRQREFSQKAFGPGERTAGVIDHIRKELREIECDPLAVSEWIDVVILGLDGAWRAGHSPEQIIAALVEKQDVNESRAWPDWRTAAPDKAIEHVRSLPSAPPEPK